MDSAATTIFQLVLLLLWTGLSTAPGHQKLYMFNKILSSHSIVEELLSSASITFAPGLFEILQASTPPTVSYFKSLPTEDKKRWAVYLLVLENRVTRSRPRIYIGSGTEARNGVSSRLGNYDSGVMVPRHVAKALEDGYTIVRKGLLCWTSSMPAAAMVPILRVLFIALEAVFTFAFWALRSKTEYGYGLAHICKWPRDELEYDGLCSHNPLVEIPAGDHSLSAEELEAQAVEALERRADSVRRCREKARLERPEKYKAKAIENRRKHLDKNPDAQKVADKRVIEKNLKERKRYCAVCDHVFTKKAKLTKHLARPKHAKRAALLDKAARKRQN